MPTEQQDTRPGFYRFAQDSLGPWVRRYSSLKVVGMENLPEPGQGAILACNHSGSFWWDALCLIAGLSDRHAHFIAHHWDAKVSMLKRILDMLECDFLDEHVDDICADSCIVQKLQAGNMMCLYPEESYHSFKQRYTLFKFSDHAVRYAELSGAPIIPVAIIGAEEAAPTLFGPKRPNVPLHFPLHPPLILPFQITIEFGTPQYFNATNNTAEAQREISSTQLRAQLHQIICKYRDCKLSDERYIERKSWV